MMMVQALRPKITRNSGYISTSGAEASAATQVSVASRTRRLRCSSTPSAMPATLSIRLAASASPQVRKNRGRMFSSTMMRSKLITMSVGFGTMKGLIIARPDQHLDQPTRTASRQATPNTNGTTCAGSSARGCSSDVASAPCAASSSLRPAARLLAQVAPDLRDVAAEIVAADDLRAARPRQLDLDHALELAGPVRHHQDAVGKLHRLGQIVGDQQAWSASAPAGSAGPCRRAAAASARRARRTARPSAEFSARRRACAPSRRAGACRRTIRRDSAARSRSVRPG